ncbi:hypothetical protein ILUMI_26189 [Ignelater luminosus]|uniref:Uncharacterized protein n=1 Tax=Ignelater luminosus TaxID=2038154 RepID=A0A8K0C720_IGNLU|nr:hypothetical protein ILUMI_26189 [Ignelater luminosus]
MLGELKVKPFKSAEYTPPDNFIEEVDDLFDSVELPTDSWDSMMILSSLHKVDIVAIKEWELFGYSGEFPTVKNLLVDIKTQTLESLEGKSH